MELEPFFFFLALSWYLSAGRRPSALAVVHARPSLAGGLVPPFAGGLGLAGGGLGPAGLGSSLAVGDLAPSPLDPLHFPFE